MADQSKDVVLVKFCNGCAVRKHVKEFYLDRTSKDGHESRCILCRYGKTRDQMDEANRIREQDIQKRRARFTHEMKVCNACGVKKSWTDFMIRCKRGPYGLYDYAVGRCRQCKIIHDEYMAAASLKWNADGTPRPTEETIKPPSEIAFDQYRSKQRSKRLYCFDN